MTKELGLLPALEDANGRKDQIRKQLTALGDKLGWDRHTTENGMKPSLRWLAKETGQLRDYDFIYHATSRFVHFSVAELLRRVWGREGDVSIRSTHFRDYWGSFALHWGLRLFLDSTIELCKQPDIPTVGEMDEEMILAAVKRVGDYGQVPIITAEELAWPT